MNTDKPQTAFLVVVAVAFVCSVLVSLSAIGLRPIQERNALIERSRNIVALSGLFEPGVSLSGEEVLSAVRQMDARVINIDTGEFEDSIDPAEFDPRAAALDPDLGAAIPPEQDLAQLGRRSRYEIVHIVWEDNEIKRVILPIVGQGMWSTLYGYIALENDFTTIAAATFYEQAETAGLGDKITDPDSAAAEHEVDGISGASVTGSAVSRLVRYWFGPDGYEPFLANIRNETPVRLAALMGGPR